MNGYKLTMFIVYFVFVTAIGIYFFFKSKDKNGKDYFLGGRKMNGFVAALCLLHVNTLFSDIPVSQYFTPGMSGSKSAIDKHHLFPKEYLGRIGILDDRERNQIANYAILDYQTNISISDNPPADYVQKFRSKLGDNFDKTCADNAVPSNYDALDYFSFLKARRSLMAGKIREAYNKICERT